MALNFPNPSRSFDQTVHCVRFSGYDSAIEVSFFVEVDALLKLHPKMVQVEAEILDVFDTNIKQIHKAATRLYDKGQRTYVCTLTPENF